MQFSGGGVTFFFLNFEFFVSKYFGCKLKLKLCRYISTHRQEGVNRTLNVWIQKLQNICQLKGGVEHANNCLDFARPAAVSG